MLPSDITAVLLPSDVSAESSSTLVVACSVTWCISMIQLSAHFFNYYTIIDFNEVYMRIYLPEKVIIHQGR